MEQNKAQQKGYTLVEVLVLVLIFSSMFIVMLTAFSNSISSLNGTKAKLVAVEIANAQMEVLRNIDYNTLGTVSGSPAGAIPQTQQVTRSNVVFTISTVIKYYDDPFDGCAGEAEGQPPDQWSQCADGTVVNVARDSPAYSNNPADYKKCDVTVSWQEGNAPEQSVSLWTIIAPKDLEGDTDKGFLLIDVIDADGVAVADANVHITNNTVSPAVDISLATDNNGQLLLLDLEPANNSYSVVVSKDGYTTDRTCSRQADGTACTDSEGVPDPFLEDLSVHTGELDRATFIIDQVSTLAVNSYNQQCEAIDGVDFTLQGLNKKVSVDPAIIKNEISLTTDINQSPHWSNTAVEWDLYDLIVNTPGYYIAGINHDLALNILPNTSTTVNVLLANQTTNALLVTVKDSGSGTNLSNASIRVVNDDQSYDETKVTGQGFLEQTDWSGGSGQADYTDDAKYFSDNGAVDTVGTTGQVTLFQYEANGFFSEDFNTTTYRDNDNTTADWDVSSQTLKMLTYLGKYPVSERQYAQTLKLNSEDGKIVSATLSATEETNGQTIDYFISADGGVNFEQVYLPMTAPHTFSAVGDELRVRIEMETDDEDITPLVHDFTISYEVDYYDTPGELISSTFDLGEAASGNSEFTTLNWEPASQPAETGNGSVKFQLATNSDNSTWNFVGPDGTAATYYTENNADISTSHDGDRYVRYKLKLETADVYYTPTVANIRIGYTLACLPPGQAYFDGLAVDSYIVEATLDGYEASSDVVDVSGYTRAEILLTANP